MVVFHISVSNLRSTWIPRESEFATQNKAAQMPTALSMFVLVFPIFHLGHPDMHKFESLSMSHITLKVWPCTKMVSQQESTFSSTRTSMTRATSSTPVSYTHLRAHETRHDLVCRLLLE